MTNQFNFKCTDKQKEAIQMKAKESGFASVSAYVKFVALNANMSVYVEKQPNEVSECINRVTNASRVADIFREMVGDDIKKKEHFLVIALDGASNIIYSETVHMGSLNQSLVHPREVFANAIEKRAAGVIIGHNHPSGTLEASRADVQITQRLKEVAKIIGIELLDHVIFTDSGYYSFSDEDQL